MLDKRTDLVELCQAHELSIELVEHSRSLGHLLDRALAECERQVVDGASSTVGGLQRLRGLILLARQARLLQQETDPETHQSEQELERVSGELQQAQTELETLQRQLDEALTTLGSAVGEAMPGDAAPVPEDRLEEFLGSLSHLCHKINNPLTAVMGRTQMLQLKLGQTGDDQLSKITKVIDESAQRVAAYVQELAQTVCRGKDDLL